MNGPNHSDTAGAHDSGDVLLQVLRRSELDVDESHDSAKENICMFCDNTFTGPLCGNCSIGDEIGSAFKVGRANACCRSRKRQSDPF